MADSTNDGPNKTSKEVASMYAWANLEGSRYRDFIGAAKPEPQARGRELTPQDDPFQDTRTRAERFAMGNGPTFGGAFLPESGRVDEVHASKREPEERSNEPEWLRGEPTHTAHTADEVLPPSTEALLQSRERVASRWFALKGVFEKGTGDPGAAPQPERESRVPAVGVFSLAGGVGKTSIVATLGRALSEYGERVLLVDATSYGLLPFYFGARELKAGAVRTFSPPGGSTDAPIHMVSVDRETLSEDAAGEDNMVADIRRFSRGSNRILADLATGSGPLLRRFLRFSPTLLVPLAPDMNSVVSLNLLESFLNNHSDGDAPSVKPYFLLSQFDVSLPLHLDVREVLREQLGDRLLPFVLRRSATVSEALAEGMTVVDYAPNSPVAEDFMALANWTRTISAPVASGFRGVRWSER
jgi:cellulose synthase operon protein YhjQ